MTITELLDKVQENISAGRITGDDVVMLRDPTVSDGAIEAGSSPWTELDNVLIISDGHDLVSGIYLEPEEY